MKRLLFVFAVSVFTLGSCNNAGKKTEVKSSLQEQSDSLEKQVDEEHVVAMRRYMTIPDQQKEINRLIDSIDKLPTKAKEVAAPYKMKLQSLNKELGNAYNSMENWMEAFGTRFKELDQESMKDSLNQRIKFFTEEKLKIGKVKDAVLGSLQKADSLLKAKF